MRNLLKDLQTNKTTEKLRALQRYFESASDTDKLWVIALFTGKRPKRTIKISLLREWAAEFTQMPTWLFEESYAIVGDLAETITLLINHQNETPDFSLTFWMQELKRVRSLDEEQQKHWVFDSWGKLGVDDRFIFNKLLTGGFRIGVSQALIVKALENLTQIPRENIHYALSGNWDPYESDYQSLIIESNVSENPIKPYPFYLAYPWEEGEITDLTNWQFEYKWDGIRGQLIKRGDAITLWSRGEEIISDSFPDLVDCIGNSNFEGVLDGEILSWDYVKNSPKPFADLQKRLGRKSPSQKFTFSNPVAFVCYDVLEHLGVDLRSKPLQERRQILQEIFEKNFPQKVENKTDFNSKKKGNNTVSIQFEGAIDSAIKLSPTVVISNWEDAMEIRKNAKLLLNEGLMIKRLDSAYGVGRKRGDWWKWKVEPETADAVLIYAQKGHGKRASRYTDFTFALKKGEDLVPFAKAYSGLTNKEIEEINHWIKDHTRDRFGPVCSVDAELVFEIAFEGVNISKRHKSGIAVRFPRIVRWRKDKTVADINSVDDLLSFSEKLGN